MAAFRDNLKLHLSLADLTVKELAALSGVSKFTIDSYLNYHRRIPSAEAAVRIARALGVTVEDLIAPDDTDTARHEAKEQKQQRLLREARVIAKQAQELVDMLEGFGGRGEGYSTAKAPKAKKGGRMWEWDV